MDGSLSSITALSSLLHANFGQNETNVFFHFVLLFFWQSLQVFVNKHLAKLSLEVVDIDSQVLKHLC